MRLNFHQRYTPARFPDSSKAAPQKPQQINHHAKPLDASASISPLTHSINHVPGVCSKPESTAVDLLSSSAHEVSPVCTCRSQSHFDFRNPLAGSGAVDVAGRRS